MCSGNYKEVNKQIKVNFLVRIKLFLNKKTNDIIIRRKSKYNTEKHKIFFEEICIFLVSIMFENRLNIDDRVGTLK